MNQPPLNPDGVRAAEELMIRTDRITKINYLDAERIISAYLAAALPEVTSVEELDQLPAGTVVIDAHGFPYRRGHSFGTGHIGEWEGIEYGELLDVDTIDYPARVLYRPSEQP